jgi:exosortase
LAVARRRDGNHDPGVTGSDAPRRLPTPAKINLAALAVVAGALAVHLWPEWTHDPDLSHGLLMPVACVMLLYLSRGPGSGDALGDRTAGVLAAVLGAAALALLWVAGLLAATIDWDSQVVDFALASSLALLGCGAVAAFAGRSTARVPFNWTSLSAALLWPLCAPFPPGFYTRLTLGLQLWVSGSVMRTLGLLGIAARRQGNIIELARGTVGIEEACSGVRSLISCVFAGLLFSAALTRRPWARVLVVVLSAPIALAMNFIRSLLLTLLVNAGVRVEGPWHDGTGYAVLLATATILLWLAIALDRAGPPRAARAEPERAPAPATGLPGAQAALGVVLALVVATLGFFIANTSSPARAAGPVPDLQAMFPSPPQGWQVETLPDIYRFAGTLRTDHLEQRTYFRNGAGGSRQITLYVAFWPAGQASVGLVGSHTPDACWPGAGWVARDVPDTRVTLQIAGRTLPGAQHRLFTAEDYPQDVWFWQLDDGHVVDVGNTRSVPGLIGIALRYGFRKGGQQSFIRISSNRPWAEVSREPFVKEFFEHVRGLGLY